jgi:hypothetical protein
MSHAFHFRMAEAAKTIVIDKALTRLPIKAKHHLPWIDIEFKVTIKHKHRLSHILVCNTNPLLAY